MRGWRAYYADGHEYTSAETTWQDLPARGLVGVVVYLSHPYRRILDGHDWIYLQDGELHVVNTHRRWGEWAPEPDVRCAACLKRGAAMRDDAWREVQERMMAAREAP